MSKPTLIVSGESLPEAWEASIIALLEQGKDYPGRYPRPGYIGKQANMIIRIEDFDLEPRVHRGFTCTPHDLLDYRQEILQGSKRPWEYTYHDRIFQWGCSSVNQYHYALQCLKRKSSSHKAVITLGDPWCDATTNGEGTHIPCLRHIGFELEESGRFCRLNTYLHWRARDAINAAFNNLFGLSFLAGKMAKDLQQITGLRILVGACVDMSDDYHVNGKDISLAKKVQAIRDTRPFEDRVWTTRELEEMCYG